MEVLERGDVVDDAIGVDFVRILVEDRYVCMDPWIDDECLVIKRAMDEIEYWFGECRDDVCYDGCGDV